MDIAPIFEPEQNLVLLQQKLETATGLKRGKARKFVNNVNNSDHQVVSWKFNEWDYYKNFVPCQARGLFTLDSKIVVRGYDKFFNVNEVSYTKESSLRETQGPYLLTVKENGCIIFVGGLADGTLIVCSKNSTGNRDDLTRNHAVAGEQRLEKELATVGKSRKELAQFLAKNNITLVMELCDDSFEEHILEYSGDNSGLYIHGINYNLIDFKTCPMRQVEAFAKEWGFKCVQSFQFFEFLKLFEFLHQCETSGTWNKREIEGFVIRCKRNGSDFFFKYKFDQPYLLYRSFREVTKLFLSGKQYNEILKKFGHDKYIVSRYLQFITKYFEQHPEEKELYLKGFGIIKVRKHFLFSLGLNEISGINLVSINDQLSQETDADNSINKYILIPIATIGCGKTTIANTLVDLLGWSHVQNDNISSKLKNKLVVDCLKELILTDVVICDRNNHQKGARKQLFEQFYKNKVDYLSNEFNLIIIGLNFIPELNPEELFKITHERISLRGDNHQSIKNDTDPNLARSVMNRFIKQFQPLDQNTYPDNEFDMVLNVDYRHDCIDNVIKILTSLKQEYGVLEEVPPMDAIKSSYAKALEYKPEFTKKFSNSTPKTKHNKRKVNYFGIRIIAPIIEILNKFTSNNELWNFLNSIDRVQSEFHVTIGHSNSARGDVQVEKSWNKLYLLIPQEMLLDNSKKELDYLDYYYSLKLVRLIICDQLICVQVEILGTKNSKLEPIKLPFINNIPHITIGTFKDEIKPFQSNIILQQLSTEFGLELPNSVYTLSNGFKIQTINLDIHLDDQRLFCCY